MATSRTRSKDFWLSAEGLTLISGWARDGLNNEQLAQSMGIGESTLYTWQSKHKEIKEAIKKNKEIIDYEVENTALKIALGYSQELVDKKYDVVGGKKKLVEIKTRTVYYAPNVAMLIFWMKNRMGDKWREKLEDKDLDTIKAITGGFEALAKIGQGK